MINRDTAQQFITALYGTHIPDDSRLVISWGESGKAITQHRWESDLDAAIAVAMSKAETHNVYFGINLRDVKAEKERNRGEAKDLRHIHAIFADLDYGTEGHKTDTGLPDLEAALNLVSTFPLAPTAIVNSGGGLHLYWFLYPKLDMLRGPDRMAAKRGVEGLRAWAKQHKVQLQTTDGVGILRLPGTINHKNPDHLRRVELHTLREARYNVETVCEAFRNPTPAETLLQRCEFFQDAMDNATQLSEPMWYAIGTILNTVDGGEALYHDISAKDAGRYDEKETQVKWEHITYNSAGPQRCENLVLTNGERCPLLGENGKCQQTGGGRSPAVLIGGYNPDLIAEVNEKLAVLADGRVHFMHIYQDAHTELETFELVKKDEARTLIANMPKMRVNGKQVHPFTAWEESPKRREYTGIGFYLLGQEPSGHYNMWKGFAVEPNEDASCALFLDHLRTVVCNGDDAAYEYLLDWMAFNVQRPLEMPQVAIALKGKQGVGKSLPIEYYGQIFGEGRHFLSVTSPKHLLGDFNAHQKNALLIFADELFWSARSEQVEGVLKTLISGH